MVDRATMCSMGYGFVKLRRIEDAEAAIASLNGMQVRPRVALFVALVIGGKCVVAGI
jgi:hypothetical protein